MLFKSKKETIYLRCPCGHLEKMNKELIAKIAGVAVTAFGCKAWIGFLFAGTGFALAICAAIVAGGVAMLAYADEITKWVSTKYKCPKCGQNKWELVPESTLMAESKMKFQKNIYDIKISESNDALNKEKRNREADRVKYEKLINDLRNSMDEAIRSREQGANNEPLELKQLVEIFWKSIGTCKKEFDIYVPFIGYVFKNKDFKNAVKEALSRGVIIKIRCGLGESSDSKEKRRNGDPKYISEQMSDLKEWLVNEGVKNLKNISYKIDNAHSKLFIVDDEYYVLSSMNFLSYSGIKTDKFDIWEELGEKSTNMKNLNFYRSKFFDF